MEYSGEYYIAPHLYNKILKNILKNKSNTSSVSFPNGIKNKVYLDQTVDNPVNIYILYPLYTKHKLIIKKNILN